MTQDLPYAVTSTNLWKKTLGKEHHSEATAVERLRNSFVQLRRDATSVAAEISKDLEEYTIHDISHVDALWHAADCVLGCEYELSPLEVYILGCAFVIHDLGMALSTVPKRKAELMEDPRWAAYARRNALKILRKVPTNADLADPLIVGETVRDMLRITHADRAASLLVTPMRGNDFLLEDGHLRTAYGALIGKIAMSHGKAAGEVPQLFPSSMGAVVGLPTSWLFRPLVIALVLRCADALQIDGVRAPRLIMNLRQLRPGALVHWQAQAPLGQPRLEGNLVTFTSPSPFPNNRVHAWWQCFDLLSIAHRELCSVPELLSKAGFPLFAARGVSGMPDPQGLTSYIGTAGWEPLDARVHVSDTPTLVKQIGGNALYGESLWVPLRELIQNAHDALGALEVKTKKVSQDSEIVIRIKHGVDGSWLEVEDNGIGMTKDVMTRYLLNFGTSFWRSDEAMEDLGDFVGKGFCPTGQFGIGFFSVFMIGTHVQVVTRHFSKGPAESAQLEFGEGLDGRPVFLKPSSEDQLSSPGTSVRVKLLNTDYADRLLEGMSSGQRPLQRRPSVTPTDVPSELASWIMRLCFCSRYRIRLEINGKSRTVVPGRDNWVSCDENFLAYAQFSNIPGLDEATPLKDGPIPWTVKAHADEQGNFVIRAVLRGLLPRPLLTNRLATGYVYLGAFRSSPIPGLVGVVQGRPLTLARDEVTASLPPAVAKEWLQEQYEIALRLKKNVIEPILIGVLFRRLGFDASNLCVARADGEPVTTTELKDLIRGSVKVASAPYTMESEHLQEVKDQTSDQCLVIQQPSELQVPFAQTMERLGIAVDQVSQPIDLEELVKSEWPGSSYSTSEETIYVSEEIQGIDVDVAEFEVTVFDRIRPGGWPG